MSWSFSSPLTATLLPLGCSSYDPLPTPTTHRNALPPLSFHINRSLESHCFLPHALPSPQCQSLSQENQSHILVISDPLPNVCGCRSCSCLTWTPPRPGQRDGLFSFLYLSHPLACPRSRGPARLSKAVAIILGWKHTYFRQITSSIEQWFSHLRVHYNHLQGWLNTAFSTFLLSPSHPWISDSVSLGLPSFALSHS